MANRVALLALVALLATALPASAKKFPRSTTTNGSGVACISKEKWDEIKTAIGTNDKNLVEWLLKNQDCAVIPAGVKVSVLDGGGLRVGMGLVPVKVRMYRGDSSAVLYIDRAGLKGWE